MNSKSYGYVVLLSIISLGMLDAKKQKIERPACGNDKQRCEERNNKCQCYCAFKPGPRNKTVDDTLIFVENDPEGNYCYCKQRDIDKIKADKKAQEEIETQD